MAWNPIQMKQENLSVLRNVFLKQHSATKPQLAKLSGLSVVTVNSLIHELLETGEVIQKQMLPSGGGRPALQYQYNGRYKMALTAYMYVCSRGKRAVISGGSGLISKHGSIRCL